MKKEDSKLNKSDHDLLIEVSVLLGNHLRHSDTLVKIALTAAVFGAINFGFGIMFILLQFGLLRLGQGG